MVKTKDFKAEWIPDINDIEFIPEELPWVNTPQIDEDISVDWWGLWWGSKAIYFSRAASAWTWTENFTWFWFTPTSYVIQAWLWSATFIPTGTSYSSYIWGTTAWMYIKDDTWVSKVANLSTRVIATYNSAWSNTRANHSAFISDWITLDFISDTLAANFIITAYK